MSPLPFQMLESKSAGLLLLESLTARTSGGPSQCTGCGRCKRGASSNWAGNPPTDSIAEGAARQA